MTGRQRAQRGWPWRGRRQVVTVAAVAPFLLAVGVLAIGMVRGGEVRETECWVLPNAHAMVMPWRSQCWLRPHEKIQWARVAGGKPFRVFEGREIQRLVGGREDPVEVAVVRDGGEVWLQLPLRVLGAGERAMRLGAAALIGAGLLAIPLFLLWSSGARAAAPLAVLYAAVAVIAVTAIAGRSSAGLSRASLFAMVVAPGALAHLGMTFPRVRQVLREGPQLVYVPYGASAFLAVMGWFTLERNPLVWPTFMMLLLALTAGCWLVLVLSCWFAIRESSSPIERARARLLCFGALLLPLLPAVWIAHDGGGGAGAVTTYLWSAAVVVPLPIALAISRYNLFDLRWDVRRWIGRIAYLAAAALVVTVVLEVSFAVAGTSHPLRNPTAVFLLSLGCVAAVEPIRGRVLGFLEARIAPRLEALRRLRGAYERDMARLHEEDAVAERLGAVLERGLEANRGAVFLSKEGAWRLAYAFGEDAPARLELLNAARGRLGDAGAAHLVRAPEDAGPPDELERAGIELLVGVGRSADLLGLVLLGTSSSGAPYSGIEIDFGTAVSGQAAVALANARLTEELVAAERTAATGKVALALAHDLGKELDWVSRLVKRLPKRFDDPARLARDVAMVQEFSEGLILGLRRFVADATRADLAPKGLRRLDDVIDAATRRVERIHGRDRISQSIDPALRISRCHQNLERVLANLLDNALHASPDGDPVRLFATLEGAGIRVVIQDRGPGIPEAMRDKVFRPGFSTRAHEGGLGIGLSVSLETIRALGGKLELEPDPSGGTRATVRIPHRAQEGT